jgi:hypothetical protein
MEDPNLGWEDPIDQASSLRSAVKELLAVGLGPRERGGRGRSRGQCVGCQKGLSGQPPLSGNTAGGRTV